MKAKEKKGILDGGQGLEEAQSKCQVTELGVDRIG